jgi:hypothetical protein
MYAEATMEMTSGAFQSENEADRRLLVQFNMHPHLNQEKSATAGRPIYEDREYIMIIVPGDKDSIVHRPAWEKDFGRFPRQYAAFKSKNESAVVGTPLKLVPWLSSSQIKELEYFNIKTVEHLADVGDNVGTKFHGLQGLKKQAKDFLQAAAGAAPLIEMRTQLEQRDGQIAALTEQMKKLSALVEKQSKDKKEA